MVPFKLLKKKAGLERKIEQQDKIYFENLRIISENLFLCDLVLVELKFTTPRTVERWQSGLNYFESRLPCFHYTFNYTRIKFHKIKKLCESGTEP